MDILSEKGIIVSRLKLTCIMSASTSACAENSTKISNQLGNTAFDIGNVLNQG